MPPPLPCHFLPSSAHVLEHHGWHGGCFWNVLECPRANIVFPRPRVCCRHLFHIIEVGYPFKKPTKPQTTCKPFLTGYTTQLFSFSLSLALFNFIFSLLPFVLLAKIFVSFIAGLHMLWNSRHGRDPPIQRLSPIHQCVIFKERGTVHIVAFCFLLPYWKTSKNVFLSCILSWNEG